jgi:GNAT superfamily N-acetyltransferase
LKKFEIVPAYEVPLVEQARVFNDAFTGYVGGSGFHFNADSLAAFLSSYGIDLSYSRFVRDSDNSWISFGYINRTGNVTRLGGMGTVPRGRRCGAGRFLVTQLLAEAKARNDAQMFLEVIEQNPPAVALYHSLGFESITRLVGWRSGDTKSTGTVADVVEISLIEALQLAPGPDYPELPWQISRHAMSKVALGRAFAFDKIAIVIGNPEVSPTRIHGYLGFTGSNWEALRTLTRSLVAKFPNGEFVAPPIFPERFGVEIFQPVGFGKEPLSQFLMKKDL